MIRENRVKRVIREGGLALSTHVPFADTSMVDIIGLAGFDAAFIDLEHDPFDLGIVNEMIRAADLAGVTPVIRVPENNKSFIQRLLEMGAGGIYIPYIDGVEGARRAVQAVRYPPLGDRGSGQTTRATDYGAVPWHEHMQRSNEEVLLVVMCEGKKAIDEIEEIAALDGLDLIATGPGDLSLALGLSQGRTVDPRLREAIEELASRIRKIGKAKLSIPMYHQRASFGPKDLLRMGVGYTNVHPPANSLVLNGLRQLSQSIREQMR